MQTFQRTRTLIFECNPWDNDAIIRQLGESMLNFQLLKDTVLEHRHFQIIIFSHKQKYLSI